VLRVADVSLFYGDRSGGIRTYLDEKVAWSRATGACEHHLIVPGTRERHDPDGAAMRHELPALRMATSNGYRIPVGVRRLRDTLRLIRPDVVLLHDPFWRPREVAEVVQAAGGRVVMVHHGSADLDAGAFRGPHRVYRRAFQTWLRHAYAPADAVMSACDAADDAGRTAELPLRFGLHPAFRPGTARRGDHVLYAGRLAREKGLFTLLEAAARSRDPWPLELVGAGPARDAVAAQVRRLGLEDRVRFRPYVEDRAALAEAYASARCVVMPGPWETFGLVAFEAAASGASVVACRTAPAAHLLGPLARTFAPEDPMDLERAIAAARDDEPDRTAAAAFARGHGWERAFARELADLERLASEERCT
jgi:alpha-1,6-mannosyltransferase